VLALALLVASFNLLWLAGSTVRIENTTLQPLDRVAYFACGEDHEIGRLEAGETVFRWLPACGDDSLEIVIDESRHCRIYVEGEMYHVEAAIRSPDRVDCAYEHLFSALFVARALR